MIARLRIHSQPATAAVALLAIAALPAIGQTPGGIAGVLAPGVAPEVVQENFVFTEGPVGTADGGVYFSDIRANRTYYTNVHGL